MEKRNKQILVRLSLDEVKRLKEGQAKSLIFSAAEFIRQAIAEKLKQLGL